MIDVLHTMLVTRLTLIILHVHYDSHYGRTIDYAFFNVGEAYLALGQPEAAVAAYEQALSFDLSAHFWWYHFGHLGALNQLGAYQRVLEVSAEVMAQAGEMEEVRLQRGLVYLGLGDPLAARLEIEQALRVNPHYSKAIAALEVVGNQSDQE